MKLLVFSVATSIVAGAVAYVALEVGDLAGDPWRWIVAALVAGTALVICVVSIPQPASVAEGLTVAKDIRAGGAVHVSDVSADRSHAGPTSIGTELRAGADVTVERIDVGGAREEAGGDNAT